MEKREPKKKMRVETEERYLHDCQLKDIWKMLPHLYPKTPGTQKSTQNLKITVIFGFLVKASLNPKTDHKSGQIQLKIQLKYN